MTFLRGCFAIVLLPVACLVVPLVSVLPMRAQSLTQPDKHDLLVSGTLLPAYKYAFRAYARQDSQAAAIEFKGEFGTELRDALRLQFKLTAGSLRRFRMPPWTIGG
jgi:hypothetical protein